MLAWRISRPLMMSLLDFAWVVSESDDMFELSFITAEIYGWLNGIS